ncbi:MAG: ATP-binding cassette domain-containing protein [Candidatus Eisenbacteria bacterium]|nr:ATP-binding cassette domain-containing protein [Candidatus Eisenbacteria bacterium]
MIAFEHVWLRYPGPREEYALEDVNLEIGTGEMVFILGPSGAGKTSLLRLVTMEELPSRGRARILEYDSARIRRREVPQLRRKVGVVYQDFRLLRDKTIFENIAYVLRMTGVLEPSTLQRIILRLLTQVSLYHKRNSYPDQLSGGEQQRASVARALVHGPRILLADEPTGNLDTASATEVLDLFRRVNMGGATVVIATHDESLAARFASRMVTLEGGRAVRDARPARARAL